MPNWSFSKVTTGTGAMAASATISVTTCACHLKEADPISASSTAEDFFLEHVHEIAPKLSRLYGRVLARGKMTLTVRMVPLPRQGEVFSN